MNATSTHAALTAAAALLLGATAPGQITQLGTGIAQSISADGTTVVGGSLVGGGAWSWTAGGGQVSIGGLNAVGASADGSIVFGQDFTSPTTAAVWTSATGWQSIGGFAGVTSGCPDLSNPYNISDGGDVATGLGWNGCSAAAFRWTSTGGVQQLPQFGPFSSRGNDVSGDGTHVGGWDEGNNGSRRAAIWFPNGTEQLILEDPVVNPDGAGEVWGFSTDGSWACGSGPNNLGAFRWNAVDGPQYLGGIPGFQGATAMAISDDGKTVVGFAGIAFFGITAFIWTEDGGMQRFSDYAATVLSSPLPGSLDFQILNDLTADGRKAVGYVALDAGPFSPKTPVLVDLPPNCGASTYGAGLSPVNYLDLQGGGGTGVGDTFLATTSGSVGSATVTLISLASLEFPTLGGFGLIDPALLFSVLTEAPVGGVSTSSIAIPADPALANLSVFLQSASNDPGQPAGWALSNGLELTICP